MRAVAHVLSVALHPLFMPLYMVFLVFQVDPHVAFFLPPEHHWITVSYTHLTLPTSDLV